MAKATAMLHNNTFTLTTFTLTAMITKYHAVLGIGGSSAGRYR